MNRSLCLTLLLGCALTPVGCNEDTGQEVIDAIPIVVDDSLYVVALNTPQAALSIENGEIRQDILQLNVSFPGGCEKHDFGFVASKGIAKSNPPIGHVLLTHDAISDSCKFEMVEELLFDLSPYREYLQSSGLLESGTILLPIKGLAETLRYEF